MFGHLLSEGHHFYEEKHEIMFMIFRAVVRKLES